MMSRRRAYILLTVAMFLLFAGAAKGQNPSAVEPQPCDSITPSRITVSCSSLGMALSNELDSYLAPFDFTGIGIAYTRERFRQRSAWDHPFGYQTFLTARLTQESYQSNTQYGLLVEKTWGALYPFMQNKGLKLYAGAQIGAAGGLLYLPVNSNNYISAKMRTAISLTSMAVYHSDLWQQPFTARLQLSLPVAGVMFAPDYGQSYYEIFGRGHYSNTIAFYTLANCPSFNHNLSLDLPLNIKRWKQTLRISYIGNFYQSKMHGIKTHAYTNMFTIGFVKTLYNIKRSDAMSRYTPY